MAAIVATVLLVVWVLTLVGVVLIYRCKTKGNGQESEGVNNEEDRALNSERNAREVHENRGFIRDHQNSVNPGGVHLDM